MGLDPREDFFLHGGSYPDTVGVKRTCCSSCAFQNSANSVRPAETSLEYLIEMTADYDDLVCHQLDEDGKAYTCAFWAALQERQP